MIGIGGKYESTGKEYRIGYADGDGISPEIMEEGEKVIDALAEAFSFPIMRHCIRVQQRPVGPIMAEFYKRRTGACQKKKKF